MSGTKVTAENRCPGSGCQPRPVTRRDAHWSRGLCPECGREYDCRFGRVRAHAMSDPRRSVGRMVDDPMGPLRARIVSDPSQPVDRIRVVDDDGELLTEIVIEAEGGTTDDLPLETK